MERQVVIVEMYKGAVNSLETYLEYTISETETRLVVTDASVIPEPPNILVIGGSLPSAETVKLIEKNDNILIVERAFQGEAKAWLQGSVVSRNFTAYDYEALVRNIENFSNGNIESKIDETKKTISDVSVGINERIDSLEDGLQAQISELRTKVRCNEGQYTVEKGFAIKQGDMVEIVGEKVKPPSTKLSVIQPSDMVFEYTSLTGNVIAEWVTDNFLVLFNRTSIISYIRMFEVKSNNCNVFNSMRTVDYLVMS